MSYEVCLIGNNHISKIFKQEVREKKRIGNNIHSRVSTRKGGTNKALKTPYYFMSRKERMGLNGEVESFNMNEIMDYNEFKNLSNNDKQNLLKHWREIYQSKEIQDKMGISKNLFYKLLKEHNVPRDKGRNPNPNGVSRSYIRNRPVLSNEEMNKYLNGEFIDFNLFKTIDRKQQIIIFKKNTKRLSQMYKSYVGIGKTQKVRRHIFTT